MQTHAGSPEGAEFSFGAYEMNKSYTRYLRYVLISVISVHITGCGYFTKKPDTNALCLSECPDLMALPDDTFGSTSKALKENADIYYNCRKACQGAKK